MVAALIDDDDDDDDDDDVLIYPTQFYSLPDSDRLEDTQWSSQGVFQDENWIHWHRAKSEAYSDDEMYSSHVMRTFVNACQFGLFVGHFRRLCSKHPIPRKKRSPVSYVISPTNRERMKSLLILSFEFATLTDIKDPTNAAT
ncbi:hypothetical protein PAAG_02967 [Paracoccidioides lutzii Pb01]|uniref:Uncharacterized protein n=1 Tax=Paracoccidioides lutzii (strain ATCC MYA-826 / Pb01) TaxID=502779 RepID=C1GWS2_PARBA|nr:hypothetical protein PAAG_02967 [Paracoccidioides lutzii Pb01]EEH40991.2 hypothetical protein PAAG_02967 [Paracoccidioides lutzii Pb01]